ncbi:hypothetical protein D082_02330 [Synechocystis sp. PCC 6714]|nr:hypothetical protein D082_02330 [Synechocystis sp. PCC 6714]
MKGMNDQNQVTAKAQSQQAEALAEAGAAQYIDFLNTHPKLLTPGLGNPHSGLWTEANWQTAWNGSYASSSSSSSSSAGTPPPQSGTTCQTTTYNSAGNPTNPNAGGTSSIPSNQVSNWITPQTERPINNGNGKVKLVGYSYDSIRNVGAISVQGIVDDNQAASQIQYAFRVRPEMPTFNNTPIVPQIGSGGGGAGLWARNFQGRADEATVYGNILDSSGCENGTTPSDGNTDELPAGIFTLGNGSSWEPPLSGIQGTYTNQDIPFPPLPNYPTSSEFTALISNNRLNSTTCSASGRTQFPQTNDYATDGTQYNASSPPTTPKVYRYRITSACNKENMTFGDTGGGTVMMYVDGDANIGGNTTIGGTSATKVIWLINGDLTLGGGASFGGANTIKNWAFFVYGDDLRQRGNADTYGFLFAPNATLDVNGTGKFAGAVWVDTITQGNAQSKIFQALNQSEINEIFTTAYTASGNSTDATYASSSGPPTPAKIELIGNYTTQSTDTTSVSIPSGLDYSAAYASSSSSQTSSASSQASSASSQASSSSSSTPLLSSITNRLACIAAGGRWNNGQGTCR